MQSVGKPVISIDTKKKEQSVPTRTPAVTIGRKAAPRQVKVHDFVDAELGKVVPYGVYDRQCRLCERGIDNDTAQFSVNSIRRWLDLMGRESYPNTDP
jgi:hypothetical protein